MRQSLQDALIREFPIFFRDVRLTMTQTSICWGCACDDGWYGILRDALAALESISVTSPSKVIGRQVKEKYGTLSIYVQVENPTGDRALNDKANRIVQEAEDRSSQTCEVCGASGAALAESHRWYKTLCPVHLSRSAIADYHIAHAEEERNQARELARITGQPADEERFTRMLTAFDQYRAGAHRTMDDYRYVKPASS